MYKNVCIILLIFLVYLIYKISSNSCDCFSVGDTPLCPSNGIKVDTCSLHYSNCDNLYTHTIGDNSEYSVHTCKKGGFFNGYRCISTGNKCVFPDGHACKSASDCNSSVCLNNKCYTPPPPPPPPKIKLEPKDKNPSQFLERINKAFNDNNSSNVFVSMIIPAMIGIDGSGSVLNKNTYSGIFGQFCSIGFIWDTDWLDKNLIDCLFAMDVGSASFNSSDCNSPESSNYCEFADTSSSNIPDRCSHGLKNYYNYYKIKKGLPNPTNCKENIIYDLDTMKTIKIENNKNCFTYINDKYENVKKIEEYFDDYVMNEGIFIKDVGEEALDYYEGIKRLKELNKPLPSALLFIYNKVCAKDINYIKTLEGLKSSFTSDTIVVKAQYDSAKKSIISFDTTPTILGDMSGYDEV